MTKDNTQTKEPTAYDRITAAVKTFQAGIPTIIQSKPKEIIDKTLGVLTNGYMGFLGATDAKSVNAVMKHVYGKNVLEHISKYLQNPLENLGEISEIYKKALEPVKMRLPEAVKDLGIKLEDAEAAELKQEQERMSQGVLAGKAYSKILEGIVA